MYRTGVLPLLTCLFWSCLTIEGKSLTLTSWDHSDVVLSGDTVKICLNATQLEFMCISENVTELEWRSTTVKNEEGMEIHKFNVRSKPPFYTPDGYVVHLDNKTVDQHRFTSITSRLTVETISDLIGGRIQCRMYEFMTYVSESLNINLIGAPGPPNTLNVSVTGWEPHTKEDLVNISFLWDDDFNSAYNVIKYNISVTSLWDSNGNTRSNVSCPMMCHPNESCVCTGLLARSGVSIAVSAINCGRQESPTKDITIKKCQSEAFGNRINQTIDHCTKDVDSLSVFVPNGQVCYNGLTYDSVATFQCDEGYSLMGKSQLRCELDGDWDSDTPTCQPSVHAQNWTIGVAVISLLLSVASVVATIIWSVLFYKLDIMSFKLLEISIYFGILFVEIILLLSAMITWGVAIGLSIVYQQNLTISSLVLSILALMWVVVNTVICFVWKRFSCSLFKDDDPVRIERDNELYYLGRSNCHEPDTSEPKEIKEDRVYDRISRTSDLTDWDESCTDSEGYIKTRRQDNFLDPTFNLENDMTEFSYSV